MKNINDLANSILGNIKQQSRDREVHWHELLTVVEEEWKEKIVNLGYKRGQLLVGIKESVAYQEIVQFHRQRWQDLLVINESKIKEIKIKLIDELGEPSE